MRSFPLFSTEMLMLMRFLLRGKSWKIRCLLSNLPHPFSHVDLVHLWGRSFAILWMSWKKQNTFHTRMPFWTTLHVRLAHGQLLILPCKTPFLALVHHAKCLWDDKVTYNNWNNDSGLRYLKIHTSISYTTLVLISFLFASYQKKWPLKWDLKWIFKQRFVYLGPLPEDPLSLQLHHHGNRWAAYQLLSAGHMATWPHGHLHPVAHGCPMSQYVSSTSLCSTKLRIQDMFFPTKNCCILGAVSVECLMSGFSIGPTLQPSYFKHCSRWFQPALRYPQPQQSWSTSHRLKWAEPQTESNKLTSQWKKKHVYFLLRKIMEKYVIFHGYVTLAVLRKGRTQASKSLKVRMSVVSSYTSSSGLKMQWPKNQWY